MQNLQEIFMKIINIYYLLKYFWIYLFNCKKTSHRNLKTNNFHELKLNNYSNNVFSSQKTYELYKNNYNLLKLVI